MSLGGPFSSSSNSAVNNSVNAGIFYAVAAGNNNSNACNFSPASAANAFTLGSTTTSDARSSFSNFGTCVDIFAPGSSITSTWNTSNSATNTISGTSMASPHAAGAAALVFEEHPTWTPFQVMNELVARATTGVLSSIGSGSPNRLLFTRGGGAPPPPPPPPTGNVFFDDFETNQGWTTNPNGTDTAGTGQWERGNPETTTSSGTKQQGTTVSGVNDLVTGRLAGSGVGSFDIDGGTTSIRSPAIALPSSGTLTLSFSYYLAHLNNSSSADFLRVSVVGNTTQQVFQEVGAGNDDDAVWASTSVNVSSFAGQTVRILIEAADAGGASLVEAAVDDVRIQSQ